MTDSIASYIERSCQCTLEDGAIEQDHLLCDQTEPSTTVYRAKVTTASLKTPALAAIIESIVAQGVLMGNNIATRVSIDKTCPVVIRSFSDPVCDPTTSSVAGNESGSKSNNDGLVIALAGIGALIALIVLLIVLVSMVLLYRRHKRRYAK